MSGAIRVPVRRVTKADIVWLGEHFCRHNHTYLEHYSCFLMEKPDTAPMVERIGIFDIETTGLPANWSIMASWCMLDHETGKITEDIIKKREIRDRSDKRIVKSAVAEIKKFDRILTWYGCLTPGHKVLTSDLRWENVENLKKGTVLLAFDESKNYTESIVLHNRELRADVYKISLSNGEELEATGNHPWLRRTKHKQYFWGTTEHLHKALPAKMYNGGIDFYKILPEWKEDKSYEAGWLAGFFDGEGCISQSWVKKAYQPHFSFQIAATQSKNVCVEMARQYLATLGFQCSIRPYDKNYPHIMRIAILGGKEEQLRFLGQIRPKRLLENFDTSKVGSFKSRAMEEIKITKIEKMGKRKICGLGTTSGTYFSNGFGSHNSRFDIPYVRTKALFHDIPFPAFRDLYHTDLLYTSRAKLRLSSNRLEAVCEYFEIPAKHHKMTPKLNNDLQAGKQYALDDVLEHCREDVWSTNQVFIKLFEHTMLHKRSI